MLRRFHSLPASRFLVQRLCIPLRYSFHLQHRVFEAFPCPAAMQTDLQLKKPSYHSARHPGMAFRNPGRLWSAWLHLTGVATLRLCLAVGRAYFCFGSVACGMPGDDSGDLHSDNLIALLPRRSRCAGAIITYQAHPVTGVVHCPHKSITGWLVSRDG